MFLIITSLFFTGDEGQETQDRRRETGEVRLETGDMRHFDMRQKT